jgi:excisionase family DNA binding protein
MITRTSKLPQDPASTASRNSGTGAQGRPVSKLLTISEVAEVFNVSPRTVRRFIDSGALPVHRLGRLRRISSGDMAAFLAANRSV